MNMQGWNRYSYVGNDPLAFTDPNGFNWFSNAFKSIGNFFSGIVKSVANFLKNNFMSILQVVVNAALVYVAGPLGAAIGAAIWTGVSGGNLGQILKAAAIAAITTFAFQYIGPTPSFASNPSGYIASVGANAAVGCGSSVASGGSCASGALSAGVGAAISPVTRSVFQNPLHNTGDLIGGTVVQATAGGLASVAGGGKFANGAMTGAFQYLVTTTLEQAKQNEPAWRKSLAFDGSTFGAAAEMVGSKAVDGLLGRVAGTVLGPLGALLASTSPAGGPDQNQYVVRGGLCDAERFCTGSGVTIDSDGNLQGVSVQSYPKTSVQELSQRQWVPQNQIGVTTVAQINLAGGLIVASPTFFNPYHATLSGISPAVAQGLFQPTILNPNPRR
jgi:hypothetical protein